MGGNVQLRIGEGVGAAGQAGDPGCKRGEECGRIGELGSIQNKDLSVSVNAESKGVSAGHPEPGRRQPGQDTTPRPAYSFLQIPSYRS